MNDVAVSSPRFTPVTSPLATTGVPGTIPDPPPRVAQLASGTFLQGTVVGRDDQGQTLVRTELGTLSVTTKAQLAAGSQVTLQIRAAGSQLHVTVMQIDGQPAGTATAAQGVTPPEVPGATNPAARSPAVTLGIQQTLPSGVPGIVTNPPPSVTALAEGTQLTATVLGKDANGQLLVRTEIGTLPITTEARADPGSQLTLVVRSSTPQLSVLIRAADPGATATQTAGSTATAQPQGGAAGPAAITPAQIQGQGPPSGDILALGQVVRAVVQSALASSGAPATSAQPPGANASGPSQALGPGQGIGQGTTAGQTALVAGATLSVRVLTVAPPLAAGVPNAAAVPPEALGGQAVNATLSGSGTALGPGGSAGSGGQAPPGGQPMVQTATGSLMLDISANLPAGTRLLLELLPGPQVGAPAPFTASDAPNSNMLGFAWPALEEAIQTLRGSESQALQAMLGANGAAPAIPSSGSRLASSMLFFLSALTGGSPGSWFGTLWGGEAARMLERAGRGDLLARLGSDLGQLARSSETAGGDWRFFSIPFYDGQHIQPIRLFLRHHSPGGSGGDGQDKTDDATRFILDVELSRVGEMQLDGLVRENRFDLILRTRQALPDAIRQNIAKIFQDANETAGYSGQLAFQAASGWAPMPTEVGTSASSGLVV